MLTCQTILRQRQAEGKSRTYAEFGKVPDEPLVPPKLLLHPSPARQTLPLARSFVERRARQVAVVGKEELARAVEREQRGENALFERLLLG